MKSLTIRGTMGLIAALGLLCAWIASGIEHGRSARHAARRAQCVNNLKGIGLSILSYASPRDPQQGVGYGVYPPGTVPNPAVAPGKRCGWASLIYFYGDGGCTGCPRVRIDLAWDDPDQEGAFGRDFEMYCPSCPPPSAATRFGTAAYVGIAGLGVDAPGLPTSDKRAGIFGDNRVVAPSDVTDGLSQTMMVVESSTPAGPWFAGGRNTVRGLDPASQPYLGQGRQFGGNHAGGADVLMADGSVRFVKDTVAPKVFEAMSTIAGGEKVTLP
jgi:prepilin-type processing-associated H-X9-DG protein